MSEPIIINVDPTNPGQFFACCGLLELADRLWAGATGWFERDPHQFRLACGHSLQDLIHAVAHVVLRPVNPDDTTSTPIEVQISDNTLLIDWWQDDLADGKELKVWAGSMESFGIARAMQHAIRADEFQTASIFNLGMVVPDPDSPSKKKEPYYFDARRSPNAHSRDIGFAPNDLGMTTTAFPAVEFLCLVGLQRFRPAKTGQPRVFDYFTWTTPLSPDLAAVVTSGFLKLPDTQGYRFENWFRTSQKKHKAFRAASPISTTGE